MFEKAQPLSQVENLHSSEYFSTQEIENRYTAFKHSLPEKVAKFINYDFDLGENADLAIHLKEKLEKKKNFYLDLPITLDDFKRKYEINDTQFDEYSVLCSFNLIRKEVARINKKIYWSFTLQEAINLVTTELPEFSELAESLKDKISFLDRFSDLEDENDFANFQYGAGPVGLGGSYIMTVPLIKGYTTIGESQLRRTITIAHEFFHVLNDFFSQQHFGYTQSSEWLTGKYSIYITLLEAGSLTLEHIISKRLKTYPMNDQIKKATEYDSFRMKYLYQNAKYQNKEARTTTTEWHDEETGYYSSESKVTPLHEIGELNYTEGARLAIALQRNGWTAHDIPELWAQVEKCWNELINEGSVPSKDPFTGRSRDFYTELINSQPNSTWPLLKAKLKALKPNRTSVPAKE